MAKGNPPENEIRSEIFDYIKDRPGASYTEIMKALNLRNGTLSYHLYRLERAGDVKSVRVGVYRRYYPANYKDTPKSIREKIYLYVLHNPGSTASALVRALRLKRQVASYHIRIMAKKSILHVVNADGERRLYANPNWIDT